MKKSKRQSMMENITQHGNNLNRIFNLAGDPVATCKKLRRLENKATRITTDLCNGTYCSESAAEAQLARILREVDNILNFTRAGIPVFINRDPRGYALKIEDDYMREHALHIHCDWGGYGILAPDYAEVRG